MSGAFIIRAAMNQAATMTTRERMYAAMVRNFFIVDCRASLAMTDYFQ